MSEPAARAVFLSYASQDADVTRRIADALRAAGVDVWFDQSELRGGEAWDHRIRRQIKECALFLPVISAQTQARREGYFRLEWKLAEERTHLMAKGTPFLVPVCIDTTHERTALVPDAFLIVQWTRLPGGETPAAFCEQVKRLLAGGAGVDAAKLAAGAPPRIPDFELLRMIGQGSYGDVWLARGVTGIFRAIKVVWRERFADAGPFEREFHGLKEFAAISLGESIQLALLHIGRNDEAGFFYYVMELADDAERGREIDPACYAPLTLAEMRARRGRIPAAECVTFGVELARVLSGLHSRGLVHRDIKPSNVILVGGVPKLADIGLVTPASAARTFVGTEGFVPPEGPGSPAADVFALGKVLYELSTGLDRQQFPQLPPELARLPDYKALLKLNEVVLRACDPLPEKRYADGRALLADLAVLQAGRSARRLAPGLRVALVAAAAAVVLALGSWWLRPGAARQPVPNTPESRTAYRLPEFVLPPLEKSLVVLPFLNLSPDPANAYFADGIQTEIIAALQRVPELMVISQTSARAYKDGAVHLAEIGRQLRVGIAITGNVRWTKNRTRIQLELRRASSDELLWAKTYDKEAQESLTVQSEIAEEVARILLARATPSPSEQVRFLTKEPRSYELLLKARSLQLGLDPGKNVQDSIPLLEEALRLDPNYAPAASALSIQHALRFGIYVSDPVARMAHAEAAKRWAEKASQLMPGGGGDAALMYYYYMVEHDNPRTLALAERTLKAWPYNAEAHTNMGAALGGMGEVDLALTCYRRARAIDPRSLMWRFNELRCLAALRRKEAWKAAVSEYVLIAPPGQGNRHGIADSRFRLTGEMPNNLDVLPGMKEKEFLISWLWLGRRFPEALKHIEGRLAETKPNETQPNEVERFNLRTWQYDVLRRLGRSQEANAAARDALMLAEKLQRVSEIDDSEKHGRLARAYLRNNRSDEAIAAGRRWVEATKIPNQQSGRWGKEIELAAIYAEANRARDCLDLLARLLRVPSRLTVWTLRLDPRWDGMRDDPRFQALLNDPKNDAPL